PRDSNETSREVEKQVDKDRFIVLFPGATNSLRTLKTQDLIAGWIQLLDLRKIIIKHLSIFMSGV
ncbi:MAG: hypothetical protein ACP5IE_09625, partial [Infirmifilum sp.]